MRHLHEIITHIKSRITCIHRQPETLPSDWQVWERIVAGAYKCTKQYSTNHLSGGHGKVDICVRDYQDQSKHTLQCKVFKWSGDAVSFRGGRMQSQLAQSTHGNIRVEVANSIGDTTHTWLLTHQHKLDHAIYHIYLIDNWWLSYALENEEIKYDIGGISVNQQYSVHIPRNHRCFILSEGPLNVPISTYSELI